MLDLEALSVFMTFCYLFLTDLISTELSPACSVCVDHLHLFMLQQMVSLRKSAQVEPACVLQFHRSSFLTQRTGADAHATRCWLLALISSAFRTGWIQLNNSLPQQPSTPTQEQS